MPIPISPTILLAAASIALLCGRYLPVRMNRATGYTLLIVGILASYFCSIEPVVVSNPLEPSTRHAVWKNDGVRKNDRVWKNDGLACSEQWIVLAFGLLAGLSVLDSPIRNDDASTFGGFLLFAMGGLMLAATSNDFLALGLSLEVVNLALLALRRRLDIQPANDLPTAPPGEAAEDPHSGDVWLNRLSSAWMWLGIALLSNATATTNFDELRTVLIEAYHPGVDQTAIGAPSKLILLASGLIATSLFARMGLVPFHLSFCGILHHRSSWVALHCLLAAQLAGAMTLTRLFGYVFVGLSQSLVVLAIVVTLATFAVSMTAALRGLSPGTRSIRDLVSSFILLQAGWLAIGPMIVAVELDHPALRWGAFPHQPETVAMIVFTQIASLLAGCGVCGALGHLARPDRRLEYLEDVKGLGRIAPLASIALLAPLASIAACPWTAGFWSRWMTLLAGHNIHVKSTSSILTPHYGVRMAILAGVLTTLAFVAVVLRLAREMFLESPLARCTATGGRGPLIVGLMTAIGSLLLGIAPHLALGPLEIIHSPRADSPRDPERGSGKNSLGLRSRPSIPLFPTSTFSQ